MNFFIDITQTLLDFHNFLLGLVDLEIERSVMNLNFSEGCSFLAIRDNESRFLMSSGILSGVSLVFFWVEVGLRYRAYLYFTTVFTLFKNSIDPLNIVEKRKCD